MRAFVAALLLAGILSATPFDQIDCWAVRDSISLTNIYVSYADSAGVGDPVYIVCWGHKD